MRHASCLVTDRGRSVTPGDGRIVEVTIMNDGPLLNVSHLHVVVVTQGDEGRFKERMVE